MYADDGTRRTGLRLRLFGAFELERDGRVVTAATYVIDPGHRQYCRLDPETQARMIARASGGRGRNRDYLYATAAHLAEEGMGDADLDWLVGRVRALTADDAGS